MEGSVNTWPWSHRPNRESGLYYTALLASKWLHKPCRYLRGIKNITKTSTSQAWVALCTIHIVICNSVVKTRWSFSVPLVLQFMTNMTRLKAKTVNNVHKYQLHIICDHVLTGDHQIWTHRQKMWERQMDLWQHISTSPNVVLLIQNIRLFSAFTSASECTKTYLLPPQSRIWSQNGRLERVCKGLNDDSGSILLWCTPLHSGSASPNRRNDNDKTILA